MAVSQQEQNYRTPRATDFDGFTDGTVGPDGFVPSSPSTSPSSFQEAASGIELEDVATEEMLINMGPQHPSTHGVLRIVLRTDGELVLEAIPHLGYLHRCAEKIGENLAYYQYVPYTDRMDYVAGMNENWAFCEAVERLGDIQVPRRAQFIRVIIGELQRIASHLVSMGTYGLDIGAFTPFLYAFREREYILDLFEMVCGARLTYSYFTIGGLTHDLPAGWLDKLTEFLNYFEPKIPEYNALLTHNRIFTKRTGNVGIITKAQAVKYALTGPVIRGSGIPYDLRRDKPCSVYPELDFKVCIGTGQYGTLGDCWDRYWVRMQEIEESVKILRQAIKMIPDVATGGAHRVKVPKNFKAPAGEIYLEMDNPRGALGFYIESTGGVIPYRVKARSGAFCNLSITNELCRNVLLADVPAIVGSIDVVMGQVDR